jgi:arylsulfatase A-like enzyme
MKKSNKATGSIALSYWPVFRLIFVIFSLYLIGDIFYRYDGFKYYASFSDYIPSVALITVFWSILAAFLAVIIWLFLKIIEWIILRAGLIIGIKHLLICMGIFILLGTAFQITKPLIYGSYLSENIKRLILISIALVSIYLTLRFRNVFIFHKSERWMEIIQGKITPLVWIFSIWLVLSISLVVYHTWEMRIESSVSKEASHSYTTNKYRKNIILVTFDALTARDMSLYGYQRLTTPFISKWAENASIFTRLEAGDNFTTPTVASLMTGKRIWTHQTYHLKGSYPIKYNIENLPLLMKNHGYFTMAFVQNEPASVRVLGMEESFDIAPLRSSFITPASLLGWMDKLLNKYFINKFKLHDWLIKEDFIFHRLITYLSGKIFKANVPPENVFNKFLYASYSEPFFAWIHIQPPHSPYLPPEPYIGMFDPSTDMRTIKDQVIKTNLITKSKDKYQDFPREVQPLVDMLRSRYDEYIRYCDEQFKNFIAQLRADNKLGNTVIILSSDHGESFEHNKYGHAGQYLYEQVTHIPLIIKASDNNHGRTIDDLVEQIDITATIIDLAGITIPSWVEGRSLMPLTRGEVLPSKLVFSMDFQKNASRGNKIKKGIIAVWENDYKLIHNLSKEKSELFNLKKDPDEKINLFDTEPRVGQHLLSIIQRHLKKANETNN